MKSLIVTFALAIPSAQAMAQSSCMSEAVSAAQQASRSTSSVISVETIATTKAYLEAYLVTLGSSSGGRTEAVKVTLMSSDCSIVSVIPQF